MMFPVWQSSIYKSFEFPFKSDLIWKEIELFFFNLITISLNMLFSVDRQPYSVFCNHFHGTQKSGKANAVSFISSTASQLCGRAKDNVPTCSTGNTTFSPWPKLPGETRCREVVVVWGIPIDRVLVAHAWIWFLKKKLECTETANLFVFLCCCSSTYW